MVILSMTNVKAMEFSLGKMDGFIKENGKTASSTVEEFSSINKASKSTESGNTAEKLDGFKKTSE